MLPWSFSEEAAAEKHMAQLQHNMLVVGAKTSVLSIINGGGKWHEISISADPLYQTVLIAAEKAFWRAVERSADSDEAGHAFQSEAGRCSELMPARDSDSKPATWCIARQVVCDDHLLEWRGQAAGSGARFFRRLSPLSSMR